MSAGIAAERALDGRPIRDLYPPGLV